jgi:hypothetical protein
MGSYSRPAGFALEPSDIAPGTLMVALDTIRATLTLSERGDPDARVAVSTLSS